MQDIDIEALIKIIPMYKVTSSNISALGYNSDKQVLRVIFKGNSSYLYFNVEPSIWNYIINSESKGKALTESVVKNKDKYKYIKL